MKDSKLTKADTRSFKGILARIRSVGVKWNTWGPMTTDEDAKAFMSPLKGISGLFGNKTAPNTWGSRISDRQSWEAVQPMLGIKAVFAKAAPWSTWGDMKTDAQSRFFVRSCLGIRAIFPSL